MMIALAVLGIWMLVGSACFLLAVWKRSRLEEFLSYPVELRTFAVMLCVIAWPVLLFMWGKPNK